MEKLLIDDDATVREAAVKALGERRGPDALEMLLKRLAVEKDTRIRISLESTLERKFGSIKGVKEAVRQSRRNPVR